MVVIMIFVLLCFVLFFLFCYGFNKCKFEIKEKPSNRLKSLLYFLYSPRGWCVMYKMWGGHFFFFTTPPPPL